MVSETGDAKLLRRSVEDGEKLTYIVNQCQEGSIVDYSEFLPHWLGGYTQQRVY